MRGWVFTFVVWMALRLVAGAELSDFKATWKVKSCDSTQVGDGFPDDVIDGNPKTFWHTEWKSRSPSHPHEIVVDMRRTVDLAGFVYVPRQVQGNGTANGRIDRYEFQVSTDGTNWTQALRGRFVEGAATQTNKFAQAVPARFFKLVSWSSFGMQPWTCVAELDVVLTDKSAAALRTGK